MAQTSTINVLLGNLITSATGRSGKTHAREHKSLRESALKTVKTQQYVRTNQFEVDASVTGLVEKFSVLNRDDLADALKSRVKELSRVSRSKWTPEILSLFLNLSDRPVEKSNVNALQLLRPPTPPESPLTWEEIIADDPLTGDIWDEVSYSAGSSDEEVVVNHSEAAAKKELPPSKPKLHDPEADLDTVPNFVPPAEGLLGDIEQSQFWKPKSAAQDSRSTGAQVVSELQVIREVILMLYGLPTSLFGIDEEHSVMFYSADISLADVSNSSLNDTLQSLANIGSDIFRFRAWIRGSQSTPLLQAFHFSVSSRLRAFDKEIANIEREIVAPSIPTMVSLMKLHHTIRTKSRPLLHLGQLVDQVPIQGSGFSCLELLHHEISLLQVSGDLESYEVMARIFFECLKVYLRPVRRWIEAGELTEQDDSFFVTAAEKECAPSSLWQDRYVLRVTADGELYAPKFLEPAGRKILNAGKSIVFLRQLSLLDKVPPTLTEPPLGFDEVSKSDSPLSLAPFSELFSVALDDWVRSKYGPASSILCQQLFSHCNLGEYMDALEHMYFSKDGIRFQMFADELFQRMDDRQKVWNDRFLLSELARGIFGNLAGIEEGRISVRTLQVKGSEQSVKVLSSIAFDLTLPWPVLNIVQRSSFPTYQRVLRLLLQIYRAKYLLRRDAMVLRQSGGMDENNRRSNFIRQRLSWFVDILFSYVLETVIQPATAEMRVKMSDANDIDAMISTHEAFISKLQTRCLLSKNLAPIHDTLISLLDLALSYTDNQSRRLNRQTAKSRFQSADRRRKRAVPRRESLDELSSDEDEGEDDDDYDADNETPSSRNESYEERLVRIQEQFGQSLGFAVAGLKGVSRVGGEGAWEMLAERLEWGLSRVNA